MASISRNAFKLFITIDSALTDVQDFLQQHKGYPIDNVIQIKLSKNYFTTLFKGEVLSSSNSNNLDIRYNSEDLLSRLENFFTDDNYHNYNNLASDITTLIQNEYNDVDINPVKLEHACKKNGDIFNYFFKSQTIYRRNDTTSGIDDITYENENHIQNMYDDTSNQTGNLKVYQVIGRELDNMISRNTNLDNVSTSLEGNYSDLDELYTIYNNEFWENIKEGDSIFIEGSFNIPTNKNTKEYKNQFNEEYKIIGTANLPIILQFVNSNISTYGYQIPPKIVLIPLSNNNYDTFLLNLYEDPGATASDFTDRSIPLTDYITATITHDGTVIATDILASEIDQNIPQNYDNNYSQVGEYNIKYTIIDSDNFSDTIQRNFNIIYSGSISINNLIESENTYYKRYSDRLTSVSHILYENTSNYDYSFIVVPYNSSGFSVPNLTINSDNSGDVLFSDGYLPNNELSLTFNNNTNLISTEEISFQNVGKDFSTPIEKSFIIKNDTRDFVYFTNGSITNKFNFIAVRLDISQPSDVTYEILGDNNNLSMPSLSYSINEPSLSLFKISNKGFTVNDNIELTFNSNTYSSVENLENAVNNYLNTTSNQISGTFEIQYKVSRTYSYNNKDIIIEDFKNFDLILLNDDTSN